MQKHRIHKIENKHTKQAKRPKNTKKTSRIIIKNKKIEANNNEITYDTEPTYDYKYTSIIAVVLVAVVTVIFSSNEDSHLFRFRPCDHQHTCPAC